MNRPQACSTREARANFEVDIFMVGLAGQESGKVDAVNPDTGAAGAFQVMPNNWPRWAKEAGADPSDKSMSNQRKVVRNKLRSYFIAFGNWDSVARAWYSGPNSAHRHSDHKEGRYPSINAYARSVMSKVGPLPCQ
jgi:hypothetical protein